jgi:hypothetical protein
MGKSNKNLLKFFIKKNPKLVELVEIAYMVKRGESCFARKFYYDLELIQSVLLMIDIIKEV